MVGRLRIRRKGFTTKSGRRVKATTFTIKDRGRPGRGPKVIPPLKGGSLGGPGFFSRSRTTQKKIVFALAKKEGEKVAVGKLRAIQVLTKRTNPRVSRRAATLSREVAGSFRGRKKVRMGTGFSRTRVRG